MQKPKNEIWALVGLLAIWFLLMAFQPVAGSLNQLNRTSPSGIDPIKEEVFDLLNTKCNTCHRKKNPFMVFSLKNMEKRSQKIHQQVFVLKRMPKGDAIRLSAEESDLLKQWLNTQNIH